MFSSVTLFTVNSWDVTVEVVEPAAAPAQSSPGPLFTDRMAQDRPQGNSLCGLTVLSCVGDWVVTGVSKIKLEPAGVAVLVATLAIVVHIRIMAGPAPDCAIFRANIRLNRVCPIVQNGEFGAVRSQRVAPRLV